MKRQAWMFEDAYDYRDYLEETLIQDLMASGNEATAADFSQISLLIDYKDRDPEFEDYIRNTLIPDLYDSGSTATAEDFEEGLHWIEQNADDKQRYTKMMQRGQQLELTQENIEGLEFDFEQLDEPGLADKMTEEEWEKYRYYQQNPPQTETEQKEYEALEEKAKLALAASKKKALKRAIARLRGGQS
jgi:hypothetical protein